MRFASNIRARSYWKRMTRINSELTLDMFSSYVRRVNTTIRASTPMRRNALISLWVTTEG